LDGGADVEGDTRTKAPDMAFGRSLLCIGVLAGVLFLGFAVFRLDIAVVFTFASAAVGILLICCGCKPHDILKWFSDGCRDAIEVILILMSVGVVIGSWITSGVVPTLICYGLDLLSPSAFLLTGFVMCCLVSLCIGSSFSTLATLGVALMGIGEGLDIPPGLTAGMVVSGALFGDKMSPFSDTTNLAPAISGTDIFKHISSMMYTTAPAMIITAALYAVFSLRLNTGSAEMSLVDEMMAGLKANFNITPILLIIPILTLVLAVLKLSPLISMLSGSFAAMILGLILQRGHLDAMTVVNSIGVGYFNESGVPLIDRLLNRGGIISMMDVVAWVLLTSGMGEMLKQSGVIMGFLKKLLIVVRKPRDLVVGTLVFSLATACLTASQYLAIIIPGMMLKDTYTKFKIDKSVLSRTIEDGGTMFSFLIPWDTAGIYTSTVLGVATLTYAPYSFLPLACPLIAVFYACIGFAVFKDEGGDGVDEDVQVTSE
jgi:NhaC family Na+:H+ antiporter